MAEIVVSDEDRRLALAALEKKKQGRRVSRDESNALKRVQQEREERLRWDHYRSVPKRHYIAMSGRQARTVNAQADLYGFPLRGDTLDLSKVLKAFHDFLADNKFKLMRDDQPAEKALTPLERERHRRLKRENDIEEKNLFPREDIQQMHDYLSSLLRSATDVLQRKHGREAKAIIDEVIQRFEEELQKCMKRK
ncbi:hypothetical protein JXA32_12945 [Candidatus Sumerlaeota bacterium]|nr:hypothetical protein [Candidatus Sumerlaeota bacterium]